MYTKKYQSNTVSPSRVVNQDLLIEKQVSIFLFTFSLFSITSVIFLKIHWNTPIKNILLGLLLVYITINLFNYLWQKYTSVKTKKIIFYVSSYLLIVAFWFFISPHNNGYFWLLAALLIVWFFFPKKFFLHVIINWSVTILFMIMRVILYPTVSSFWEGLFSTVFLNYMLLTLTLTLLNKLWINNTSQKVVGNSELIGDLSKKVKKLSKKNEKLKNANKTQKLILAMISHDMKSPLSSLMGLVTLIRKNLLEGVDLKSIIEQLDNKIKNTSLNIDNILEWSKNQHNGFTFNPSRFDLNESIQNALNFVQDGYSSKGIMLNLIHKENYYAYGDENIFQVVIRNLLSNAYKFTPANGVISIEVSPLADSNLMQISIQDSGIGIDTDQLKNIYNKGYSTRGTEGEKGTGLGLMITKSFVEANNGSLSVKSGIKQGSIFSVTIPSSID